MSIRFSLLTLSLGAALLTPFTAQADNYPASHFIAPSGPANTRAEVVAELAAWRMNPQSHDGQREIGGEALLRVSASLAPSGDIRIAALNGYTLASGLAGDEARAAANSTATRIDRMQVSYAKVGVASPSAAATPSPVAVMPIAQERLFRLFSAR